MKKISILSVIFLCFVMHWGYSQKTSNIDFDAIKTQVQDSTSATYYPLLLERMLQLDSTLTSHELQLLYYGNVFYSKYSPYGRGEYEDKCFEAYKKKDFAEAIRNGELEFKENPVNVKVLKLLLLSHHKNADSVMAKKYAKLFFGILDEIYKSGDGKSIATAYVVLKVADEYVILSDLGLSSTKQSLLGVTDKLTIETKGQNPPKGADKIKELYFNVSQPLAYMNRMFQK
ncbi:MAG TPA: DUF4919 domain-containing protein [Bacteroidales bacterium]|nr:MAG: hypothetical protein BWY22_02170 [Bacteroidetes bacterium ADurb.Bin217]HPH17066.1 DUF4919 domain-containing protein [Bacteroidales bacterium]HPM12804.1 DUF4919 domain-containing protein [Bacteroidales bacterium]